MPSKLSILVFVASPLDFARYRYAALYFEFEKTRSNAQIEKKVRFNESVAEREDDIKSSVMEVVGSPGVLSFYERVNIDLPAAATGK